MVDDFEMPALKGGTGNTVHVFRVTVNQSYGAYEVATKSRSATGETVGRRGRYGGVWYSFGQSGYSQEYLGSVSLSEVRAAVQAQGFENFPAGLPSRELSRLFLTALPTVYTEAAVEAAHGGPRTPPSSILNVLKATGYRMERYYIDRDDMDRQFTSAFVEAELAIFATAFPDAEAQVVDAAASPASLRSLFTNEGSYYIVVVNGGQHWIGVTADTIYNSLGTAPVKNSSDFGQLDGNPNETETNTFTGLVIEIRKN